VLEEGGRAAACPSLQPLVGKQPFPPPSSVVLDGFRQRGEAEPPPPTSIWAFFAVGFSVCPPSVLAVAYPDAADAVVFGPAQLNAGWRQSLRKRGFSALPLPGGCHCLCRDGKRVPFVQASASALETLSFHGTRKMLWLMAGWEKLQSDGLTLCQDTSPSRSCLCLWPERLWMILGRKKMH